MQWGRALSQRCYIAQVAAWLNPPPRPAYGDRSQPRRARTSPPMLHALHPSVLTIWRIRGGLWWGVFFLAAAAYDVVHLFRDGLLPPGVLSGAVLIVAGLYVWQVPRLRYRAWRYGLVGDELYVERGVLNRVKTVVPLLRLQHLDVSQNILEKEFDLGKLIVHTAGTRNSTVTVPGLAHAEAEALRDQMKAYVADDAL